MPGLTSTPRQLIAANGSVPGPALVVDQGDWVIIDVTNALTVPTVLHVHGQLQVGTPWADGVPGLSQCPIAPGTTLRYEFRASNAGTYAYAGCVSPPRNAAMRLRQSPRA